MFNSYRKNLHSGKEFLKGSTAIFKEKVLPRGQNTQNQRKLMSTETSYEFKENEGEI